jgi:Holliday junction DNA helicase RuvA
MIAKLSGRLDATGEDWAIVDVGGVGYLVHCSSRTLAALGEVGEGCTVHTELQVSENDMRLLGFADQAERDWFRLLTGVQGVGGKVALSILSTLAPDELTQAVARQDKVAVSRANGVGPKLAERIVRELKDKVGGVALGPTGAAPVAATGHAADAADAADAASALTGLGFKPAEANAAVAAAEAELGDGATLDALVRMALKKAAK